MDPFVEQEFLVCIEKYNKKVITGKSLTREGK